MWEGDWEKRKIHCSTPPKSAQTLPSEGGDELVVWSLQTEDLTEKDSTFYHIVCSNVGEEDNIHVMPESPQLANFKVRSLAK